MTIKPLIICAVIGFYLIFSASIPQNSPIIYFYDFNPKILECVGRKFEIDTVNLTYKLLWISGNVSSESWGDLIKINSNTFQIKDHLENEVLPVEYLEYTVDTCRRSVVNLIVQKDFPNLSVGMFKIMINDSLEYYLHETTQISLDEKIASIQIGDGRIKSHKIFPKSSTNALEIKFKMRRIYFWNVLMNEDTIKFSKDGLLTWIRKDKGEKYSFTKGEPQDFSACFGEY